MSGPAREALVRRVVDGQVIRFDQTTSRRMADIRRRDTRPEILVRSALSRAGLRFRVDNRDLPGSPDIANRARRWAIFVHNCYWHRHEGCPRTTTPKRNAAFWQAKFDANVARDTRVVRDLRRRGFTVMVIWECNAYQPERLERFVARCRRALEAVAGVREGRDQGAV